MGKVFTLVLAFLASLLVAGVVQNLLGVYAKADLEFVLAMVALVVAAQVAALAFGVALFARWSIDRCAIWLAALTVALAVAGEIAVVVAQSSAHTFRADLLVLSYIVVPILVAVGIQWVMVRRRAARDATAAQAIRS